MSKKVPLLNRLKDKYRRKLAEADIDDNTRYELLQRLEGTKIMTNYAMEISIQVM